MTLPPRTDYEQLVYSLQDQYPEITRSALSLYSIGPLSAVLEGSLYFSNGLELRVVEVLDFRRDRIQRYDYTVFRGSEKIRWYDSQPHPDNPELASTFPHHRHEPPDIKNHRVPAPGISFTAPNLPTLIADCIELGNIVS